MSLRIYLYNEPILRKKGAQISDFDSDLESLSKDMVKTMYEHDGIGLAAQQVGRDLMLCVVDVPQLLDSPFQMILDGKSTPPELVMPMTLANPVVELLPCAETTYEEGCLSLPEQYADVSRPKQVKISYLDRDGSSRLVEAEDLLAVCLQHEIDHLEGVLFVDHITKLKRDLILRKLRKMKKLEKKAG